MTQMSISEIVSQTKNQFTQGVWYQDYCILLLYHSTLYMQETHEIQVKSSCELCSSRMQLRVVQLGSKRAM